MELSDDQFHKLISPHVVNDKILDSRRCCIRTTHLHSFNGWNPLGATPSFSVSYPDKFDVAFIEICATTIFPYLQNLMFESSETFCFDCKSAEETTRSDLGT